MPPMQVKIPGPQTALQGLPPETMEKVLGDMPESQRAEVLQQLPDQDLEGYMAWKQQQEVQYQPGQVAPTYTPPSAPAQKSIEAGDLQSMSDPDLQALAESLKAENPSEADAHPNAGGMLDNYGGMTLREFGKGALQVPELVAHGLPLLFGIPPQAAAQMTGGLPNLGGLFEQGMDALGAQKPFTPRERLYGDALQAAGSTATSGGLAGLAKAMMTRGGTSLMSKVAPKVVESFRSNGGKQLVGNIAGAEAGGIAREEGADGKTQLLASLLGGFAPGATGMGIKKLMGNPKETAVTLEGYKRAGTMPTAAEATNTPWLQKLESALSRTWGSSGTMRGKTQQQENEIGAELAKQLNEVAPGARPATAAQDARDWIEKPWMKNQRLEQDTLWDRFYATQPKETLIQPTRYRALLEELSSSTPNAKRIENDPKYFADKDGYRETLVRTTDDLKANDGKGIPFSTLQTIKSKVGGLMEDSLFKDRTIDAAAEKRLYGALAGDIEDSLKPLPRPKGRFMSDKDVRGWELENERRAKAMAEFQTAKRATDKFHDELEMLRGVIDKNGGPEKVYEAAFRGAKNGGTALTTLMTNLDHRSGKTLAAAFIKRAGNSAPGVDDFSIEQFAKNWSNFSPEAQTAILSKFEGPTMREDLDNIAKITQKIASERDEYGRATKASEPVQGASRASYLGSLLLGGGLGSVTGGNVGTYGAALAAGFGTMIAGQGLMAKLLVSPKFVHWLAKSSTLPKTAAPIALNQLARINQQENDPYIAEYLDKMTKLSHEKSTEN